MQFAHRYLRLPHVSDCDCAVCFAQKLPLELPTPSTCPDCRPPGRPYLENGRWHCRPRSFCTKHDPRRRPPQYWRVIYDSGKPTPFVPLHEPFELEA